MPKAIEYRRELEAHARQHRLKLLGVGVLNKQTLAACRSLICRAVDLLERLQPGEVISMESERRDDVFIVVRSYETIAPRRSGCCHAAQPPTVTPATVTDEHQARASFVGLHRPSPPGRT